MDNILLTLTEEEKKAIQIVSLNKDQMLFNEGDVCESIGIVISGVVEIISYSFEGGQIIFNHLEDGMIFGNNLIFSSDPHYKGAVIAKKPTKVALIYKKQLISLLKSNEEFMLTYLRYQSDIGKQFNFKIKLLSMDKAEDRFLYYLHSNGDKIYYKSITHLAGQLFLQRETTSRLVARLEQDGIIKRDNHYIRLKK